MSKHIKRTKALFVLSSTLLISISIFGIYIFQHFNTENIKNTIDYVWYKQEVNKLTQNGLIPTASAEEEGALTVPVFVYHGIVPKNNTDRFNMSEETFKDQMFALKQAGWDTITTEEFIDFIKYGKPVPKKSFLLTFDDGRVDSFTGADPILRALNYTAVMYVSVESSFPENGETTYYLNKKELKHMIRSGRWEIGSHAIQKTGGFVNIEVDKEGNFLSNRAWIQSENRNETIEEYTNRLKAEINNSKTELETTLNTEVKTFSYPFGDYGQQTINNPEAERIINERVAETYEIAFRQTWQKENEHAFNQQNEDSYHLRRIETPTDWSGETLTAYLNEHIEKSLPYSDTFTENNGWQATWANAEIKNNELVIAASAESTGAAVYLHGTSTWKNYKYTVETEKITGSHLSLMTAYIDEENYNVCTFGEDWVKIEEIKNGIKTEIKKERSILANTTSGIFGVQINEETIECIVGDSVITTGVTSNTKGGIGIRIWDKRNGLASAHVQKVNSLQILE